MPENMRHRDFLTYNGDLMVINNEAHHVHNASDAEQKRWQESFGELREKIRLNKKPVMFVMADMNEEAGSSRGTAWLTRFAPDITGVVDQYVSEHIFGRKIDFNKDENIKRLRNQQFVKLNQYAHQFSIPYINKMGHLMPYYTDFVVKTKDSMHIKSTKDANTDIDTKIKALAASEQCLRISRIKNLPSTTQPRTWNYVLLPQNIFEELEGNGMQSLIERCEANLTLLKMRRE